MRRDKLKTNMLFSKLFIIIALFLFMVLIFRVGQLSLTNTIDGIDIKKFSSQLKTVTHKLDAKRGTIYDKNNNILAQNISSYTVVACLSDKCAEKVEDKEKTAKFLAPIINMEEDVILNLLNKDLYQVEIGPGGRNISQLLKDQIANLNLSGISFLQNSKRYYPNGDYASYLIGYAKEQEDGYISGEMGIEKQFDEYLKGVNGYSKYQADRLGTKIATATEITKTSQDGSDIYLTIDTNIQLFVEEAVESIVNSSNPEWVTVVVADAKTGAILGTGSSPSFDPNVREITSYVDPLVSITYEPGSTMKIFTYLSAIENGKYNGDETYTSGSITFGDDTIKDWNVTGWGTLSYDQGFALSSNVGVSTMFKREIISKKALKETYTDLGFGLKTGITLSNEAKGTLDFKYEVEVANAAFGQGITTTVIQNIQALTAISNNGILLKPYIVEKIVNDDEIVYQGGKEELGRVASETTVNKVKELMRSVMGGDGSNCTGYRYNIPQYNMMGKSGTAQIYDEKNGGYLTGTNDYLRSFAEIFPSDDPQVIIYAVVKKGYSVVTSLSSSVKTLSESVGKYLSINQDQTNSVENVSYDMPSYINKTVAFSKNDLNLHNVSPIIIGSGTKVINQYPDYKTTITYLDKVILFTNSTEITLPSFYGWSKRDFITFAKMTNINYNINGSGYITSQSIPKGTIITDNDTLEVTLSTIITD